MAEFASNAQQAPRVAFQTTRSTKVSSIEILCSSFGFGFLYLLLSFSKAQSWESTIRSHAALFRQRDDRCQQGSISPRKMANQKNCRRNAMSFRSLLIILLVCHFFIHVESRLRVVVFNLVQVGRFSYRTPQGLSQINELPTS